MRQLEQLIEKANRAYYIHGEPILTDFAFDESLRQLKNLERAYPELASSTSPTRRINEGLSGDLPSKEHTTPMLSLANATCRKDLELFVRRLQGLSHHNLSVIIEPKVDGLSSTWSYRKGQLQHVLTRGNGKLGEEVTAAARTILEMPLQLQPGLLAELDIEIRGEVYMRRSIFSKLNDARRASGDDLMANPRNAAVGSLKLKDPKEVARRRLSFVGYELVCNDPRYAALAEPSRWFKEAGVPFLQPAGEVVISGRPLDQVVDELEALLESFRSGKEALDMDTDGAVLKVIRNLQVRAELGDNGVEPAWAVAFKYPPEEVTTTLREVIFQVGRMGTVTPVASLDPVWLSGSTISRATLHNAARLDTLGLQKGSTVGLSKAGEVIPQVTRLVAPGTGDLIRMPKDCPSCGTHLVQEEEAAAVRCPNKDCVAVAKARLCHAVSKVALDFDGVGEVLIEALVDKAGVRRVSDLLKLDPAHLLRCGVAQSADTIIRWLGLITQASARKLQHPASVLYALSIPHIGNKASNALIAAHGSVKKLLSADESEILGTPDLLPIPARSWLAVRDAPWLQSEIRAFELAGFNMDMQPATPTSNKLADKRIVITGDLSHERGHFEVLIRQNGGKLTGSVSKKTNYLIVGSNPGHNKIRDANKHGVPQIDEAQFWALLA